jgi:hypothetical protein
MRAASTTWPGSVPQDGSCPTVCCPQQLSPQHPRIVAGGFWDWVFVSVHTYGHEPDCFSVVVSMFLPLLGVGAAPAPLHAVQHGVRSCCLLPLCLHCPECCCGMPPQESNVALAGGFAGLLLHIVNDVRHAQADVCLFLWV